MQHIVILAEHHLLDYKGVEKRFSQIQPLRYPRWLVALMVGLSCACSVNSITVAGMVPSSPSLPVRPRCISASCWHNVILIPQIGSLYRFRRHHHFRIAFATPSFSNTPTIAMAASVLLLVPGFPLINAVADMFKGHINPDWHAGRSPVC